MAILRIIVMLIMSLTFLAWASTAHANISAPSASLNDAPITYGEDNRVKVLQGFLTKYNSPLLPHAETFVREADRNGLDYRLVVSIAGVESGFGKRIPYNSYNGWGWGVYGSNVIRFASWDEGITTISASLRTKYMNRWGATDVHEIGRFYASDPMWSYKVTTFMDKIEAYEVAQKKSLLSISL